MVWSEGEKNHPGALLLAKSILSFSLRIKFRKKCERNITNFLLVLFTILHKVIITTYDSVYQILFEARSFFGTLYKVVIKLFSHSQTKPMKRIRSETRHSYLIVSPLFSYQSRCKVFPFQKHR